MPFFFLSVFFCRCFVYLFVLSKKKEPTHTIPSPPAAERHGSCAPTLRGPKRATPSTSVAECEASAGGSTHTHTPRTHNTHTLRLFPLCFKLSVELWISSRDLPCAHAKNDDPFYSPPLPLLPQAKTEEPPVNEQTCASHATRPPPPHPHPTPTPSRVVLIPGNTPPLPFPLCLSRTCLVS